MAFFPGAKGFLDSYQLEVSAPKPPLAVKPSGALFPNNPCTVGREHIMERRQVDSGLRHRQGDKRGDEVQRLEYDVRGTVAVQCLEPVSGLCCIANCEDGILLRPNSLFCTIAFRHTEGRHFVQNSAGDCCFRSLARHGSASKTSTDYHLEARYRRLDQTRPHISRRFPPASNIQFPHQLHCLIACADLHLKLIHLT